MSKKNNMTEVYHYRRIDTLVDPDRYSNCTTSYQTILRFIATVHQLKKFKGSHLDVGCGDGVLSQVFSDNGWASSGVDISDGVNFETDSLPFKSVSFDLVTLYGVIEHIADPDNIFKEVKRVLRPDGICVMITTNVKMSGMSFYDDPDHKKPYTPKGLSWLAEMYGFQDVKVGLWTVGKPSGLWKIPMGLQELLGVLIPFEGRNKYLPNFLKGRSRTMICAFRNHADG